MRRREFLICWVSMWHRYPSRLQYGIRINESKLNKSLGMLRDISQSQHCRAEFYLNDLGWVPVDPADMCKVIRKENLPANTHKQSH